MFSSDHQLILPEGTTISGEVTLAKQAQRFHRNGQLRFLFERVHAPEQASAGLLAALYSVQSSDNDHVAVDDEGGATLTNAKTRFIAPALAILALHASVEQDGHRFADPDGDGSIKTAGSGVGSRGLGGFLGFGLLGAAVGQITRPIGIALSVAGAGRTIYTNILGKGREVSFPADTPIQVRLALRSDTGAVMRRRPWLMPAFAAMLHIGVAAQQPAFRAATRMVVVHATVRGSDGELVTTLDRSAFTVYENGKRQPIAIFRRDDIPVSLGLLIDNSGSMRTLRSKVEAAALALARASNPQDEIFVLNFNDHARIDVPFTSDVQVLESGVRRVDSIGGTALRDAIDMAQTYVSEHGTRDRKVLLRDHGRHRQCQCGDARTDRAAGGATRHRRVCRWTVRRRRANQTGTP